MLTKDSDHLPLLEWLVGWGPLPLQGKVYYPNFAMIQIRPDEAFSSGPKVPWPSPKPHVSTFWWTCKYAGEIEEDQNPERIIYIHS